MLDFVFEDGFGFERYVDYLLDVPMYFSYRDGKYIDLAGKSFRDFLAGKLPELPGAMPTLKDWADHMTTAFPEVRLKKFLEMRGADGGPWNRLCALPAFWVGLLYDSTALDAAWDLVKDFTNAERHALRDGVPKHALKLPFRNGTRARSRARSGEDRGARPAAPRALNSNGADESIYPRSADRDRRCEPDAGRAQARAVPRRMEGRHRSRVPRVRVLMQLSPLPLAGEGRVRASEWGVNPVPSPNPLPQRERGTARITLAGRPSNRICLSFAALRSNVAV